MGDLALPADRWAGLPEERRAEVLTLLGRMIARGVLAGQVPVRAGQAREGERL